MKPIVLLIAGAACPVSTAGADNVRHDVVFINNPAEDYLFLCGSEFDVEDGGYMTCKLDINSDGLEDQLFSNAGTSGNGGKSAMVYLAHKDGKFARIGGIGHGAISPEKIKTGGTLLHCSWSFGGGDSTITTYLISYQGLKEVMKTGGGQDDEEYQKRFEAVMASSLKPDYKFVAARPKPFAKPAEPLEWPVIDGASPNKKQELVTIPIFESDPQNGTPYRIALRDAASKQILDSFLWEGDMGDPEAHKENRAFWSPDGRYLAVYMRSGRLSATAACFLVEHNKLARVAPPDAWQNVLGRFNTTESGPNGGISPVSWIDRNLLKMAVIGSAETAEGRIPFHYHAIYKFEGGDGVAPYIRLKSVDAAPDNDEQDAIATPATPGK